MQEFILHNQLKRIAVDFERFRRHFRIKKDKDEVKKFDGMLQMIGLLVNT